MRRFIAATLLFTGCATAPGQKITVLLNDKVVPCELAGRDAADVPIYEAYFELTRPDDFYSAELVTKATGVAEQLAATRVDRDVVFTCPDGFDSIVVRHAAILQAQLGAVDDGNVDDGSGGRPAP